MKEQYNEAGNATEDVFYDSTTGHAQVDSTVTATGLRNRPSNYYDNGTAGPSAVVKADGSTVVYYYYKLKEYTYTFNINNSQATLNKGGHSYTGSQYVLHVKLG